MGRKKKRKYSPQKIVIPEKPVLTKEEIKKRIIERLNKNYKELEKYGLQPALETLTKESIQRSVFEYHKVTKEENERFNNAIKELKEEGLISEHMKILWIYPLKGKEPAGYDYSTVIKYGYIVLGIILFVSLILKFLSERDFIIGIATLALANFITATITIILEYKKGLQISIAHILNRIPNIIGFIVIVYALNSFMGYDLYSAIAIGAFIGLFIPTLDKILIK